MVNAGENAYQVLGLNRECTREEIKKAFQQLAKATHPDMQSDSHGKETAARFIRVLAAYQILSDPHKRSIYDRELSYTSRVYTSTSTVKSSSPKPKARYKQTSTERRSWENTKYDFSYEDTADDSDVVEWLRQYRSKITRMVQQRELGTYRSKLFESYHTDLVNAIRNMYYGPDFRALRGFPDVFEAEERSNPMVTDILQLVYGRYLFATVSVSREQPKQFPKTGDNEDDKLWKLVNRAAYDKLELRVNGKRAAHALRRPLYSSINKHEQAFVVDSISIYSDENEGSELLGRIQGLASTDAGLQGVVFDNEGDVTHTILQHTTPMVRHLHWYRVGSQKMFCDCRCRRAWLFPSRYWVFQPRSLTHNIGGWYIETFKPKRQISPSKLHPAIYILAAAYKTLDVECTKKRKLTTLLVDSVWSLMKKRWSGK